MKALMMLGLALAIQPGQTYTLVTYPNGKQFLVPRPTPKPFKKHPRLTDPVFDQYGTPKFYYQ